jgi:hypothetical protein
MSSETEPQPERRFENIEHEYLHAILTEQRNQGRTLKSISQNMTCITVVILLCVVGWVALVLLGVFGLLGPLLASF